MGRRLVPSWHVIATHDVDVEVLRLLVIAQVGDDPRRAVSPDDVGGDLTGHPEDLDQERIVEVGCGQVGDVALRNDHDVHRRVRRPCVVEGEDMLGLAYLLDLNAAGHDIAVEVGRHYDLGPTNVSRSATESRFATEISHGPCCWHWIPRCSQTSRNICWMSRE